MRPVHTISAPATARSLGSTFTVSLALSRRTARREAAGVASAPRLILQSFSVMRGGFRWGVDSSKARERIIWRQRQGERSNDSAGLGNISRPSPELAAAVAQRSILRCRDRLRGKRERGRTSES